MGKLIALLLFSLLSLNLQAQTQKVILITGGFSGLGQEVSKDLLARGYKVILAGRDLSRAPDLRQWKNGHNGLLVSMDMGNLPSIAPALEKAVQHFGRLDVVIHNAAQLIQDEGPEIEVANLRRSIEINLFGAAELTNLSLTYFRQTGFGRIIYFSSAASVMYQPGMAPYSTSKAAAEAYFQTIGLELEAETEQTGADIDATIFRIGVIRGNYTPKIQKDRHGKGRAVSEGLMSFLRSVSPTTPATVSEVVVQTVEKESKSLVRVGLDSKVLSVVSMMPTSLTHSCAELLTNTLGYKK